MLRIAILCSCFIIALAYKEPPQTFLAKSYTTWSHLQVKGSRRAAVEVDFLDDQGNADYVKMIRLDLVGDASTRGFASGALLSREILEFSFKLNKYFADYVLNIDISKFPEPLQNILKVLKVEGAIAAPTVFKKAMGWVWSKEEKYVPEAIKEEIAGMASGLCSVIGSKCDIDEWTLKLQALNMLPELIRMACTAYGAWGNASASDSLIQVRALDFGSGPFPNYTVIATHRLNPKNLDAAFVSVTFPGFVGVITGVSQSGIGISEKVWMVNSPSQGLTDLLPGSYDGEADVFVLRDILEYSKSKVEAEKYLQNVNRTWAMWIGIGDYSTGTLDLVGYQQPSAIAYTDVTMPSMTNQPYIPHVAYVDKHPQPSDDPSLPKAITDFYGNISLDTSKIITQYHQTGDVHIASYDFGAKIMNVAIGKINKQGDFGEEGGDMNAWKAYNRPYISFSLTDLWSGV